MDCLKEKKVISCDIFSFIEKFWCYSLWKYALYISDALRNMLQFAQFKKRKTGMEKYYF